MNIRDLSCETADSGEVTVTATCRDCERARRVTIPAGTVADAERLTAGAAALMDRAGLRHRSGIALGFEAPEWTGLGRVAMALALDRLPECRCGKDRT